MLANHQNHSKLYILNFYECTLVNTTFTLVNTTFALVHTTLALVNTKFTLVNATFFTCILVMKRPSKWKISSSRQ